MKIPVEHPDACYMAIDRLGFKPFSQKVIYVLRYFIMVHFLNRDIDPKHKMPKDVHVVLHRVCRVVAPLQKPPVVHNHVGDIHPSHSFQ